ncbi:hypothetical protein [Nocardia cyriacigeorgica]|uniref:hypothetical protein n=1 Tax=Nocardia cyriacigeorgica TaxID=135487 RepID=UPI002454E362|nr:hypothetical protein [Nocardia cyriacigeorgica]
MTGTAFLVDTGSTRPRAVSVAFTALMAALLCGLAEALARAAIELERPDADLAALATGSVLRLTIYLVVAAIAVRMARGDRRARSALAVGIGVLGTVSLIIEPVRALLSAEHVGDLVNEVDVSDVAIGLMRAGHIVAVLVAVPAMYSPAASRWFRGGTRLRSVSGYHL